MKIHLHLVQAALQTLRAILAEGRSAEKTVSAELKSHPKWGSRDRRQFAETVYDLVRWWRQAWYLAGLPDDQHDRFLEHHDSQIWRTWAAWSASKTGVVPTIPEAADLQMETILKRQSGDIPLAVRESIPNWLDAMGSAAYQDQWPTLLHSLNQPADVFLRANRLKNTPAQLLSSLAAEGTESTLEPTLPDALRLLVRKPIQNTEAFRRGLCEVQDAGSQGIAPMLQSKPGEQIADVCAGAGGKALHLAALMEGRGRIMAMDIEGWKLAELQKRAERCGVDIIETTVVNDAPLPADLLGKFDAVLLDVPCSGLGVLRRLPDTKWRCNPQKIDNLTTIQRRILERNAPLAKPGGRLVYATCSILPAENEAQVQWFLSHHPEWKLEEERHWRPDKANTDGFYAARIVRLF